MTKFTAQTPRGLQYASSNDSQHTVPIDVLLWRPSFRPSGSPSGNSNPLAMQAQRMHSCLSQRNKEMPPKMAATANGLYMYTVDQLTATYFSWDNFGLTEV